MNNNRYHYVIRGSHWVIYKGDAPTDEWFNSMEDARKRVFELNGWKYTGKLKPKPKPFMQLYDRNSQRP